MLGYQVLAFYLILSLSLCAAQTVDVIEPSNFTKLVVYTNSYTSYRSNTPGCEDYAYSPGDLPADAATHIYFSFLHFSGETYELTWFDEVIDRKGIEELKALKELNPLLKIGFSVGGGTFSLHDEETVDLFPELIATADTNGPTFAKSCIALARELELESVDIDYEWPQTEEEGDGLANLLKIMREEFEAEATITGFERLELSVALAGGNKRNELWNSLSIMNEAVDFMNIMSYELRAAWTGVTNSHTVLKTCGTESYNSHTIENVLDAYLANGAQADKLVMGMATYGRTYQLTTPDADAGQDVSAASDAVTMGTCTQMRANLAYYEVKNLTTSGRASSEESMDLELTYSAWITYDDGASWVGYDNPTTFEQKMCYFKYRNVGGVMLWDHSNDDHNELLLAMKDNMVSECLDYCRPLCPDEETGNATCADVIPQLTSEDLFGEAVTNSTANTTSSETPASGCVDEYVVQAGDTLADIATTLGSTVDAIVEANESLTSADSLLEVGQTLIVPGACS